MYQSRRILAETTSGRWTTGIVWWFFLSTRMLPSSPWSIKNTWLSFTLPGFPHSSTSSGGPAAGWFSWPSCPLSSNLLSHSVNSLGGIYSVLRRHLHELWSLPWRSPALVGENPHSEISPRPCLILASRTLYASASSELPVITCSDFFKLANMRWKLSAMKY